MLASEPVERAAAPAEARRAAPFRARRRWYTPLQMVPATVLSTMRMLRAQQLGGFIPLVVVLLVGAVVLWMVNAIAPLAPFVYSLF